MPEMPAGAQVSDDGFYWWDEANNQWQPIEQGGATSSGAASTGAPEAAAGAAGVELGERTGTATAEGAERPADAQPVSGVELAEVAQGDAPELSDQEETA